jgi:hypothetical protein
MPWNDVRRHDVIVGRQNGSDIFERGDRLVVATYDPSGEIYTGPVVALGGVAAVAAGGLALVSASLGLPGKPRPRSVLPLWASLVIGGLVVVEVWIGLFAVLSTIMALSGDVTILVGLQVGLVAAALAPLAIVLSMIAARRRHEKATFVPVPDHQ